HKMDPVEGGDVPFLVVGNQLVPVAHLPQLAAGPAMLPGAPAPGMGGAQGGGAQGGGTQNSFGTSGRSGAPAGDNQRDSEGRPQRGQAAGEKPQEAAPVAERREAWCALCLLDAVSSAWVERVRAVIDPADLAEPFIDPDVPHVTVLYGMDTPSEAQRTVVEMLSAVLPVPGLATGVAAFTAPDHDVLYLAIDSPDLHAIHAGLARYVLHDQSYANYVPHCTLAYLKSGAAARYLGAINPTPVIMERLRLSPPEGSDETPMLHPATPQGATL
ncbi:MAG: 2'-5' RNA ligase family protein, partial [Patescibacteria group bacterium]|nr:2'-5' RNA ligase family protein [Patescibacteria group bacterium]